MVRRCFMLLRLQVTTIPFDWIVLAALGLQRSNSTTAW
jgi:hypothetical protein